MKDFLTQAELTNYKAYTELNHTILDLINSIGIPVALIGGHADIDQKYIEVILQYYIQVGKDI